MRGRAWVIVVGVLAGGGTWAQDDGGVRFGLSPGPTSTRTERRPPRDDERVERPRDPCAEFNAEQARRRARHTGPCPYCPCACVRGGEITCAPCARCDPNTTRPELEAPTLPPRRPVPESASDGGR